jgi:cytochrome c oxidase cbb3-type subunit 4
MQGLASLQSIFSTLWVVWFFVLFIGILLYVLAPRRRASFEQAGMIPLQDEAPRNRENI